MSALTTRKNVRITPADREKRQNSCRGKCQDALNDGGLKQRNDWRKTGENVRIDETESVQACQTGENVRIDNRHLGQSQDGTGENVVLWREKRQDSTTGYRGKRQDRPGETSGLPPNPLFAAATRKNVRIAVANCRISPLKKANIQSALENEVTTGKNVRIAPLKTLPKN